MTRKKVWNAGFTIVELLIVIVVIAILATIASFAYDNARGDANDARRIKDIQSIAEMIEVYQTRTGSFPAPVGTSGAGGWEVSTNGTSATDFLSVLRTSGLMQKVPVDPKNTGNPSALTPSYASSSNYEYFYYRYAAGVNNCDSSKGAYYVIGVTRMDTVPSGSNHPDNPGFECPLKNWSLSGAYVIGGYANG